MRMLKQGNHIRIRRDATDEWVVGVVTLVSENGRSIVVQLGGMIRAGDGFNGGIAALTIDPEAQLVEGLFGDRYEVEVSREQATYSPTD